MSTRSDQAGGPDGLRVVFPDLPPVLVPLARLLGVHLPDPGTLAHKLPAARWPELRRVWTGLGPGWQRRPESELWAAHQAAVAAWREGAAGPGRPHLLELTWHLAHLASSPCHLCAAHCGARRREGEAGPCGSADVTRIDRLTLLEHEEPFLGRGLGIFPAGCNVQPGCIYCLYPWSISAQAGEAVPPQAVSRQIASARRQGATHTHWIGGNMDQHIPFMLDVLSISRTPLPVVYHTNGSSTDRAMALVGPIASVISVDCRHGSAACAAELGSPLLAPEIVRQTLRRAARSGALVIARVLGLPGKHLYCCTIHWLELLAREFKDQVLVNLMDHAYIPSHRACSHEELNRPLSTEERQLLDQAADRLGLRRLDGR